MKLKIKFLESLETRQVKYGGYAAIITLAVIIGLVLVNLIFQQLSPQFDLTQNKLFSLSDQTQQVLGKLDEPVTIYGLWEPGKESQQIKEVLDNYASRSKNIHLHIVDPDTNPGLMMKYDREGRGMDKGSLIVEGSKGFRVIRMMDMYDVNYMNPQNPQITGFSVEKRVTDALLYVSTGITPVIYEITGHKEVSLIDMMMKDTVERENYELKQLNLMQSEIPEDAAALVINSPSTDYDSGETEKILTYLEGGGKLLIAMDFRTGLATNLNDMLASYGLKFDFGLVIELDKNYNTGNPFHVIPDFGNHEIVAALQERKTPAILSLSRGLSILDMKRRTIEVEPLLASSRNSMLRIDLSSDSPALQETDQPGPILMGVAVREQLEDDPQKETRIVAFSCGEILSPLDPFGQVPGNIDLFMNGITWLEDRQETLSVRSKNLMTMPLYLGGWQIVIYALLFVGVIPLALFGAGLFTWLRRRHL